MAHLNIVALGKYQKKFRAQKKSRGKIHNKPIEKKIGQVERAVELNLKNVIQVHLNIEMVISENLETVNIQNILNLAPTMVLKHVIRGLSFIRA
jgi:hypothetical protein